MSSNFWETYHKSLLKSQEKVLDLWLDSFSHSLAINPFSSSENFRQTWNSFEELMTFFMATQAIEMNLAINLQQLYWNSYFKLMRQNLTKPQLSHENSPSESDKLYIERALIGGSFHLVDSN